jgi:ABC transporter, substrate-binding protein, aliphatic sulfonates family
MKRSGILAAVCATAAALIASIALSGCSGPASSGKPTMTVGYFPNLTHAPALVGVAKGLFASRLGDSAELKTATFNAGPSAIEALNAGAVDIAFIGPSPTITGFTQSKGQSLRVIAGAAANGASLVVREGITDAGQLAGTKLATPQLGNTQDVALRYWLKEQGLETTTEGGGEVSILPQDNATALQALATGEIDGAWVPEPWASRMVSEDGAHVLVNEADLWPDKQFVVTNVVVRTEFLAQHPELVKAFLSGLLDAIDYISADPAGAQDAVNSQIEALSGKAMKTELLESAWKNVTFTVDPLASTLREGAAHAVAVGLLEEPDLAGLYSLDLLNELLAARGEAAISEG